MPYEHNEKKGFADVEQYHRRSTSEDLFEPGVSANPSFKFDANDLDRVQRRLKQRHVQMIAIAGTIGTGLFLGSGHALKAARWVDPALGFAVGWNYFYAQGISTPSEVSAAVILLSFWDSNQHHVAIYTTVIILLMVAINIFGVRWFGEAEFIFSIIKICLIVGLIIAGLVIDLGGGPDKERIGFRYWKHPGPLAVAGLVSNVNLDRFLGILNVLIQAAFSFQSMELVAIAASETENPRRNIRKAVGRVFWRIFIFYLHLLFITHSLRSGVAWPSAQVPRLLHQKWATAPGRAYHGKIKVQLSNRTSWFVNLTTTAGFFSWFTMNLTYIFYHRGMKAQGRDFNENAYHNPLQPYVAYWGVIWTSIFILVNGFAVFFNFNVVDFLTSYLNIPIFAVLYFGFKIVKRTKIWRPEDMDFDTGVPSMEETESPELPPKNIFDRIGNILF
ncbi:hypothetical protein H0H93_015762 [Arthromyces matolae]|nr:hypothetical protein H0H93_015762 [Arthromyces matolae]